MCQTRKFRRSFYKYLENETGDNLSTYMKLSEEIAEAVLTMEESRTAALIQQVHSDFISSIEYNDENSLSCTITVALLALFQYYHKPVRNFHAEKDLRILFICRLQNIRTVLSLSWN